MTVVEELWIRFSKTSEDFLVCVDDVEDHWQDIGSFIEVLCKLQRWQSGKSRSRSSPAARRWTLKVLTAEATKAAADAKAAAGIAFSKRRNTRPRAT